MGSKRKSSDSLQGPARSKSRTSKASRSSATSRDAAAPKPAADGNTRLDEAEGVWSVIVTSAAPLLCTGVFELTVTQGTVEVGGAHICAGTAPVAIAPSDARAVTQISAVQTESLRCLAQLPAASATLLLRALSADCAVGPVNGPLASASLCQEHAIPAAWSELIATLEEAATIYPGTVVLVCGAKKVGKSTLCRRLVNALLQTHTSAALLDADAGQPELGPPGLLSLSTLTTPLTLPPHLSARQPCAGGMDHNAPAANANNPSLDPCAVPGNERAVATEGVATSVYAAADAHGEVPRSAAVFLGDVSPQAHPALYLAAVVKLLAAHAAAQHARAAANEPAVPLVINTPGWVKGLGLDLLVDVVCAAHVHVREDRALVACPVGEIAIVQPLEDLP